MDGARGERHAARHRGGSPRSGWLAGTIIVLLSLVLAGASLSPIAEEALDTPEDLWIEPRASATVFPSVETDPSHHANDTADDMAIWIHPTDPSLSLVIGDDKEGGLMVWGLDGRERQYVDGNLYNNLDLRYNFPLQGTFGTGEAHTNVSLLGVSNQGDRRFDFFKVNPTTRLLEPVGGFRVGITPYGGCMYLSVPTSKYYFLAPNFSGVVEQWEVRDGGDGQVVGNLARSFDVGNITEGCVADDLLGHLYLAQEDVGIWKYGAEPDAGDARTLVDSTDGGNLVADVEGLTLYYDGPDVGYLFASSQGESKIVVYTREGSNSFLHKFDVGANGTIDRVTASDGIDVTNFPLGGPFGAGLVAVHDQSNEGSDASNVKFVSYAALASALGLVIDTLWDPRLVGAPPPPPPPPPFDFTVAIDPASGSVAPGGSVLATVNATLVSGASREIAFACEGLPTGASCTFTPPACLPTCSVGLSLLTDPATPDGTYDVTINGSEGTISRTAIFRLTVATPPPPFDFVVAVGPASGSVAPGGSVVATVNATLVSGSSDEVAFACGGLPVGTACTFTPPACPPTCSVGLTLTTSPDTPDGAYEVTITGSDGTISRAAIFSLTVATPPPPPFDFALTLSPTEGTVARGEALAISVNASLVSGATREVRFSCEALPPGAWCTFTPPACDPACEAILLLGTGTGTPEGLYSVDVRGSDGAIVRNATFRLTVIAPPPPPPVPTSLVLEPEVPDPSWPGEDVTWVAVLVRDDTGDPVVGRSIVVEWTEDGGLTWWPTAPALTDGAGRATGSVVFPRAGEQRLRARFDGDATFEGSVSTEEVHTTRNPSPPTAGFTFDPADPQVGDVVTFDASTSTSEPGTTLQARWDWDGDGDWDTAWSSTLVATHAFFAEGTYSVALEVRDSNNLTDSEVRSVLVQPPPVPSDTTPPAISTTSPANGTTVTDSRVTFTGTAEDDREVIAVELSLDGSTWIQASGTATWSATLNLSNGTNMVYVRATDGSDNERTVLIFVTLAPSDDASPDAAPPKRSGVDLLLTLPAVQGSLFALAILAAAIALVRRRSRIRPTIIAPSKTGEKTKSEISPVLDAPDEARPSSGPEEPPAQPAEVPDEASGRVQTDAPPAPPRPTRSGSMNYLMEIPLDE